MLQAHKKELAVSFFPCLFFSRRSKHVSNWGERFLALHRPIQSSCTCKLNKTHLTSLSHKGHTVDFSSGRALSFSRFEAEHRFFFADWRRSLAPPSLFRATSPQAMNYLSSSSWFPSSHLLLRMHMRAPIPPSLLNTNTSWTCTQTRLWFFHRWRRKTIKPLANEKNTCVFVPRKLRTTCLLCFFFTSFFVFVFNGCGSLHPLLASLWYISAPGSTSASFQVIEKKTVTLPSTLFSSWLLGSTTLLRCPYAYILIFSH